MGGYITFKPEKVIQPFDHFEHCGGFRKQLGEGKGEAKLIVNDEKKGTMVYNGKEEISLWMLLRSANIGLVLLTLVIAQSFFNDFGDSP